MVVDGDCSLRGELLGVHWRISPGRAAEKLSSIEVGQAVLLCGDCNVAAESGDVGELNISPVFASAARASRLEGVPETLTSCKVLPSASTLSSLGTAKICLRTLVFKSFCFMVEFKTIFR
jgi:hypothetical protein